MLIATLFPVRCGENQDAQSSQTLDRTNNKLKQLSCWSFTACQKEQCKKHNNVFITGRFSLISVWKEMRSREETENSLNLFKKDRDRHLICGAFFCANLSVKPSSWGGFFFCYIKHHQKRVEHNSECFLKLYCLFVWTGVWVLWQTKFVRWVLLLLHQA